MATLISRLQPQFRAPPDDTGAATPDATEEGTGRYAQPGPLGHRLIGVVIVLSLILLAFILWLLFAKRPRRKLRSWGCTCLPAPPERIDDGEEKFARTQNSDDRSESWIISHGMEAHRMGGVDSERSTFQAKRVLQEGVREDNEMKKGLGFTSIVQPE
ncbi:hypothetical protein GGU11DRAFT_754112 [Lentinula aff. detonsa]|nr:hypothetical protein GGU11DRAFT_754112 [Lentinula aff. detonsa]